MTVAKTSKTGSRPPARKAARAGGKPSAVRGLAHRRRLRVALIADTHGTLDLRVLILLRSCDLAVHAGDVGGVQVLRAVASQGLAVYAVRGNNDTPAKWPSGQSRAVRRLPQEAHLRLPGGALVVVHGDRIRPAYRRHDLLRRRYAKARAVVYGHTHRAVCDTDARPWVLNPGAAGHARTFGGPSCIVLTAGARRWHVRVVSFSPSARGGHASREGVVTTRSQ